MAVSTRPLRTGRPGSQTERKRGRPWWHYAVLLSCILVVAGLAWGAWAAWFGLSHVHASSARITGLVVNVAAKGDARVQHVLVRTGDEVSKGQIVAELDRADLAAELDQAKASLAAQQSALGRAERELELTIREVSASVEEASAQLEAAHARLRQSEAELKLQSQQQPDEVRQASADLASAKSRLADAEATLKRMEKLSGQGAVSQQSLDAARTNHQVAEAGVEAAEAALAVARAQSYQSQIREQGVATRRAEELQAKAGLKSAETQTHRISLAEQQVLSSRAAVAEAEAAVQAAQARLSYAVLRSPINGVVVSGPGSSVKEGETVEMGRPIVTVLGTDVPFWISASVSELYAGRVKEGQPVLIRVESLPRGLFRKRWLHGRVEKIGAATEFQTAGSSPWMIQQVPIRIGFDPQGQRMTAGATCRVWIDIRR